jgi:hypothetical protein
MRSIIEQMRIKHAFGRWRKALASWERAEPSNEPDLFADPSFRKRRIY